VEEPDLQVMTTDSRFWLLRDTRAAHKQGAEAVARRQRDRLADIIAFARARYYREHYRHLPDRVTDPTLLPVTSKAELADQVQVELRPWA
jgi:hypothetical protein